MLNLQNIITATYLLHKYNYKTKKIFQNVDSS